MASLSTSNLTGITQAGSGSTPHAVAAVSITLIARKSCLVPGTTHDEVVFIPRSGQLATGE